MRIGQVRTADEAAAARRLARAFVAWLDARYPERIAATRARLRAEDFEGGLARLTTDFAPPRGACLLARRGDAALGTVMLHWRGDGAGVVKRLFVAPEARGLGVGRRLCAALIHHARDRGGRDLLLSAGPRHDEALALYRSLGFVDEARAEPGSLGDAVHMRLALADAAQSSAKRSVER